MEDIDASNSMQRSKYSNCDNDEEIFERKLLISKIIKENVVDTLRKDYMELCIQVSEYKKLHKQNPDDKHFKQELMKLEGRKKEKEEKLKKEIVFF